MVTERKTNCKTLTPNSQIPIRSKTSLVAPNVRCVCPPRHPTSPAPCTPLFPAPLRPLPRPISPIHPPLAFPLPSEVENQRFRAFEKKALRANGQIDGPTDQRTDRPSYRDAWAHLKKTNFFLA